MPNPFKPKNPLERLMVGWTGKISKWRWGGYRLDRDRPVFCALKKLGINLVKRLIGWEKLKNDESWKNAVISLTQLRDQYKKNCGGEK
jgi:hypothetical protein